MKPTIEQQVKELGIELTDDLTRSNQIKINRIFRKNDESHLWPISGKFNATEKAIKSMRELVAQGLDFDCNLSYILAVEREISRIVNSQV